MSKNDCDAFFTKKIKKYEMRRGGFFFLYRALSAALLPAMLLTDIRRGAGLRELAMRFGFYGKHFGGDYTVWLHAASVGEANAAFTLIENLYPARSSGRQSIRILMSVYTISAYVHVLSRAPKNCDPVILPYDLSGPLKRFLRQFTASRLIIVENDFWPLLLRLAGRCGMCVVSVSSSLSESSLRRRQFLAFLSGAFWKDMDAICVQTPRDARRFVRLGARPAQVFVCGNIKFDARPPSNCLELGEILRRQIGKKRAVWIAASAHPGELEPVLHAHKDLLQKIPNSVLILAPRYIRHTASFGKEITRHHLSYRLLSCLKNRENAFLPPDVEVLLADTTGDLFALYAASDLAFVGGSLVAKGGHNPIEPALLGIPILMGADARKSARAARLLLEQGAMVRIRRPDMLAPTLVRLMTLPPAELRRLGRASKKTVGKQRGVSSHIREVLRQTDTLKPGPVSK